MAQLDFKGPFHFDHLQSLQLNETPGIYIWGFVLDTDSNSQPNLPVDFTTIENQEFILEGNILPSTFKFIPYYVGKDKTSIENRLIMHHTICRSNALKYTRMYISFYKDFFKTYPIHIRYGSNNKLLINNYIKSIPNSIEYYNNDDVLKLIYKNIIPVGSPRNWPINKQMISTNQSIPDSLKKIICHYNNFWFCYAELENPTEDAEAQVFYSLKGITISQTKSFNGINIQHKIKTSSCKDIFKHDSNNSIIHSIHFLGY
jgi:hypothetical protein